MGAPSSSNAPATPQNPSEICSYIAEGNCEFDKPRGFLSEEGSGTEGEVEAENEVSEEEHVDINGILGPPDPSEQRKKGKDRSGRIVKVVGNDKM